MSEVQDWMNHNRLKLNPSKTEFVLFGTKKCLLLCLNDALWVSGTRIYRELQAKYLGVLLDEYLSLHDQITKVCSRAMLNLARIHCMRPFLLEETCKVVVQALVLSHLDYANTCYAGIPKRELNHLQRVQNQVAKLILRAHHHDSTSRCLQDLHWLPCAEHIQYKILVMVFKCLHNMAPDYLSSLLKPLETRSQRQGKTGLLHVPFTKCKTLVDRAFSVVGPKLWNNVLTPDIRSLKSLELFKTSLKTHLFRRAYQL